LFADTVRGAQSSAYNFFKAIPSAWDESKLVGGVPGQYVTVARRRRVGSEEIDKIFHCPVAQSHAVISPTLFHSSFSQQMVFHHLLFVVEIFELEIVRRAVDQGFGRGEADHLAADDMKALA
jgi:hypothetical protein